MRIGSLFSGGLDGLSLGLAAALDGTVAFTAEKDDWRRAQLKRNYPEVPRHLADVSHADEPVDLLCGGFPCQPHSVAGVRRGTSDDRFGWPLFAGAIDRCRPSLVVIENVPGLRTSGLRDVLTDLAALGFDAEWSYLSAADVGAPHRRTRFWLVAWRMADADEEGQLRRAEVFRTLGDRARDCRVQDWGGWASEPAVGRVAHGFPDRKRWLSALGDAVVPWCAYVVGLSIRDWLTSYGARRTLEGWRK